MQGDGLNVHSTKYVEPYNISSNKMDVFECAVYLKRGLRNVGWKAPSLCGGKPHTSWVQALQVKYKNQNCTSPNLKTKALEGKISPKSFVLIEFTNMCDVRKKKPTRHDLYAALQVLIPPA